MKALFCIPAAIILTAICSSCSVTRHIPEGRYLLSRNEIDVEKEEDLSKGEMIRAAELDKYVAQRPNKRTLGTNLNIWIYTRANPDKDNWWNRFKRKLGSEPVLFDSTMAQHSAEGMKIYMDGKGFLNSDVSYSVDTARRRKARVTYRVRQGAPYRIGKIDYDFRDRFIRPVILSDSASSLLRSGRIFDVNVLDEERVRITDYLKNRGYYTFSINNIEYVADSTAGDRTIDITMVVKQDRAGYTPEGEPVMRNNRIYRIRDISVQPDYNPTRAVSDPGYGARLDTLTYKGLDIVYKNRLNVRPDILRRSIGLYPNSLYSAADVQRTYDNIMRLGYYKSASVLFSEVNDTTAADNYITFIGEEDAPAAEDSVSDYTQESYLSCDILCTPAKRQSYTVELEGTTSSDYFGITAKIGYQNRNLFRGVELFDVSLRCGYEFMRVKSKKNSFEIGAAASFSFPRFIFPWRIDRYNKAFNPTTKVEFSYSVQQRPYYHRTISSGVWGYAWGNGRNSNFVLRPIDVSVVKLKRVDQEFLDGLENPYLRNSYVSQLIAGLSGSYIFNNQPHRKDRSSLAMRFNFETNGNLIDGLYRLFSGEPRDHYDLFGIRYAQYFRIDANIAKKFVLGPKTSLVYRFYAGWGYAYGNSNSIPFERLFYCGGSNSMRGWLARTLGPGNEARPNSTPYPSQLGNFKLETNLEGRFPVWGILQGALFFDLGNIWFIRQGGYNSESVFHFDRFYKQLGFNTGLGARFDFNFFVFRVDWGIPLHNPNNPRGDRWISRFRLKDTTLNFGVGYPF